MPEGEQLAPCRRCQAGAASSLEVRLNKPADEASLSGEAHSAEDQTRDAEESERKYHTCVLEFSHSNLRALPEVRDYKRMTTN